MSKYILAKLIRRKNKQAQKRRSEPSLKRSKQQVNSGIDRMKEIALEMNSDLKRQNFQANRINEKAARNVQKLRSVNSALHKNLNS